MIRKNNSGVTLIEMVIVIIIIGIIVTIGATILINALRASHHSQQQIEVSWQTNLAFNRMGREIRDIANTDDLTIENFDPTTKTTNTLKFKLNGKTIVYSLSGNTLQRQQETDPPQTIATQISGLTFTYYTSTYAKIPTATDVGQVKCIKIATNILQTVVCPRNLQ